MSAVANAIVDAQDKVDRHQIEVLRHFFDPAGRPVVQTTLSAIETPIDVAGPQRQRAYNWWGQLQPSGCKLSFIFSSRALINGVEAHTRAALRSLT
jgi:hypothetical protein